MCYLKRLIMDYKIQCTAETHLFMCGLLVVKKTKTFSFSYRNLITYLAIHFLSQPRREYLWKTSIRIISDPKYCDINSSQL